MKSRLLFSTIGLLAASFAPAAFADGRNPGSVLVYTIHRSGLGLFTVISVTNTNVQPQTPSSFGGSTLAHFSYLNTIPNPDDSQLPLGCYINDRVEFLTPADTLSVLTTCHNAASAEGYVVIVAEDPSAFGDPWKFNYLIGSEIVVNAAGGVYSINAIPFNAIASDPSDDPLDLHFNGSDYEAIPRVHYCDSFLAVGNSSLTLINLTGGADFTATVRFEIWNDNEFPLSATKSFRCWMEEQLQDINLVFSEAYLTNNVPNDLVELDINCDNLDDFQTGWFRLTGIVAFSSDDSTSHVALLGAITAGPVGANVDGGRLLWEKKDDTVTNGVFLHFGPKL